jgi:outer membrane lipoprotein-sorting protein
VRMTSFRTNVPVDASAFSFDVPAGVRVVDR